MLIDGWGEEGQARLKASSVFIAGAGGLGSPVSIYLAVAGVGQIRICDSDQAEVLKYLTGTGATLKGKLLIVDAGEMFLNSVNV
jgi:molybdopterin/thiamine biosynthesis adenylyltransferase